MKPFEILTRSGKTRRMRGIAYTALEAYGIENARIKLIRNAGNILYHVYAPASYREKCNAQIFEPGHFLLRLHWPGYRDEQEILSELWWLRALRNECDLPVPEPMTSLRDDLLVTASAPGIPKRRFCSLLRWVRGRRIGGSAGYRHYAAQGRFMAGLHNFSSKWRLPNHLRQRQYDYTGLFADIPKLCLPVHDTWALLPKPLVPPFQTVAEHVHIAMETLGNDTNVYGLIHADLGVDANLIFLGHEPRAIDFDECGLGYWIYDLAVALEHCREERDYMRYRNAFLRSYSENRSISQEQIGLLDLFMAALDVHIGLWANAVAWLHPERKDIRYRSDRCLRLVLRFLDTKS